MTPRPNFLVLVGNHYGWRPLPPQIPTAEYDQILDVTGERRRIRALLETWYRRDDNADPPEHRLRPRTDEFVDPQRWGIVEARLRAVLALATADLGLEEHRRIVYEASATEQEIVAGALGAGDPDQVVCFLRGIEGYPDLAETNFDPKHPVRTYVDTKPKPTEALQRIRARLRRVLGRERVLEDTVTWRKDAPELDEQYLSRFAHGVHDALKRAIAEELQHPRPRPAAARRRRVPADDQLDEEGRAHHDFAEEHVEFFEGREDELAHIDAYLLGATSQPLVVHGGGGTGKSALMAEAVRRALEDHSQATIAYRFVGATPGSSDGRTLLRSLAEELARRAGEPEADVPSDYAELVSDFSERLGQATPTRPIVVFVDSLDQLSAAGGARTLSWIPLRLPDHARLVVSTRPGETLEPLEPRAELLELRGLSRADGDRLLDAWLHKAPPQAPGPAARRGPRQVRAVRRQPALPAAGLRRGSPLDLRPRRTSRAPGRGRGGSDPHQPARPARARRAARAGPDRPRPRLPRRLPLRPRRGRAPRPALPRRPTSTAGSSSTPSTSPPIWSPSPPSTPIARARRSPPSGSPTSGTPPGSSTRSPGTSTACSTRKRAAPLPSSSPR